MRWTEPDFTEISLNMEVTAYVRTDDSEPLGNSEPLIAMWSEEDKSASTRH